jgi:hypothetical protein
MTPSDEFAGIEFEPDGDELARLRDESDWFKTLPPERQADALNRCSDAMESSTRHVVVDGEAVAEGSVVADLLRQRGEQRQRREAAIASRRTRLAGIVTPLVRRRDCGRAPRTQRTRTGSAGCRSPGRSTDDDDEPADPLGLPAVAA